MGNEYEKLINQFNSSLQHFEELGDIEMQANIVFWLGYFNSRLGKKTEIEALGEKTQKLFTAINEVYPVFLISIYRMNELIASGETEEAKKIEFELIELITSHENENTIGLIASTMATNYRSRGRWVLAIEYYLKSLEVFNQSDDLELMARSYFFLGLSYENLGMNSKAADSYLKSIAALEELQDTYNLYNAYGTLVFPLIALEKYDEARKYMTLALHDTITANKTYILARYNDAEGQIFLKQGKYEMAIANFNKAFEGFNQLNYNRWAAPFMKLYLSECYLNINDYSKALSEGLKCLEMENALNSNSNTIVKKKISLLLSEIYEQIGDQPMAYEYLKMYQEIRAESDKLDETNRIADAEVRSVLDKSQKEIDELEKEKLQQEQESKIQKLWIISIAGALISALILSVILYRNNRNKQRANALLKEQKEEIETTLEKLEATQNQLIQSEKMASLGELTAGIAHEIQNPLNFVNNFSEVNAELVAELKDEIKNGNLEEVVAIASDIEKNEEKIKHHGQRAEGIVKGMLQHSRTSQGEKETTDINALADEYLRLAYHGLRAKDKSFNAEFKTNLDPSIPKIEMVSQDIGRVLLNLINNAFYACIEKSRNADPSYRPMVTITTKKNENSIRTSIKDNGTGISDDIKEKIFQPFFTTKPAGKGTGLGLSLSYDIVKMHEGNLEVSSIPGQGTEFNIKLPIKK
jgi:signal transduction histidine kinase